MVIALFAALSSLLWTSCATPGRGAYPTLKQTQMNVEWPMTAFRNASARGWLTLGQRQRINADYQEYRTAFDAAVKAANGNMEVTTPDNVKQLASSLISAISAMTL